MAVSARKLQRTAQREQFKTKSSIAVTLKTLRESADSLFMLAGQPLPARVAFLLAKVVRKVRQELEDCETQRMALLERFTSPPEENKTEWEFASPEKRQAFLSECDDLFATEIALDIPLISISDLSNLTISALVLAPLDWLIAE